MLVPVADRSQIAGARRSAIELAIRQNFDEGESGRVGLIATELATNLIKHAQEGHIALSRFDDAEGAGVEILALDKGNGIADVQRSLTDGTSTAGTAGHGLGAIRRQSDEFAIYSRPKTGTAVMARVRGVGPPNDAKAIIGVIGAPYPGETVSGDGWAAFARNDGATLLVVDGTGHGAPAAAAAEIAKRSFLENSGRECLMTVQLMHRALAPTRGAAVAVARATPGDKTVRFVGVGNIVAAVINGAETKRMVSNHGTLGHVAPRMREFNYPCERGALIILHSDGLSAKWDFADYPGLSSAHPSIVAAVLFRDHRRGRDDAIVAAMRVMA